MRVLHSKNLCARITSVSQTPQLYAYHNKCSCSEASVRACPYVVFISHIHLNSHGLDINRGLLSLSVCGYVTACRGVKYQQNQSGASQVCVLSGAHVARKTNCRHKKSVSAKLIYCAGAQAHAHVHCTILLIQHRRVCAWCR